MFKALFLALFQFIGGLFFKSPEIKEAEEVGKTSQLAVDLKKTAKVQQKMAKAAAESPKTRKEVLDMLNKGKL